MLHICITVIQSLINNTNQRMMVATTILACVMMLCGQVYTENGASSNVSKETVDFDGQQHDAAASDAHSSSEMASRFTKRAAPSYGHNIMRFGRAPHNIMHFGKRAGSNGSGGGGGILASLYDGGNDYYADIKDQPYWPPMDDNSVLVESTPEWILANLLATSIGSNQQLQPQQLSRSQMMRILPLVARYSSLPAGAASQSSSSSSSSNNGDGSGRIIPVNPVKKASYSSRLREDGENVFMHFG